MKHMKQRKQMRQTWIWILVVAAVVAGGAVTAQAVSSDAKALAAKGLATFMEVLSGNPTRYTQAVTDLEAAAKADPKNIDNLYVLARAYFYNAVTYNRSESLEKAKATFEQILAAEPKHTRALSFHGSILTAEARGDDLPKFFEGVGQMMKAVQTAGDPGDESNNRIVRALTVSNFPPEALAAMKGYNRLQDLESVKNAFDGQAFYYAPHASVVMQTLVGDEYWKAGKMDQAKELYRAALAVPKPGEPGAAAGRAVLDAEVTKRLNGGPVADSRNLIGSCYSCHLTTPEKLSGQH